ncbi:MAG: hypothetical protein ABEI52_04385, partial [Halobacteriaceae archaeon]
TKSVLVDRVKLCPADLHAGYVDVIREKLVSKVDGRCTPYGFVRSGSIELLRVSMGSVETRMLNGDICFTVQYRCLLCNLTKGAVLFGKVMNLNRFAVLVGSLLDDNVVVETIVPKQSLDVVSLADLDRVRVDDIVRIEVVGSKYELNDKKIRAVARILSTSETDVPQGSGVGASDQRAEGRSENEDAEDEDVNDGDVGVGNDDEEEMKEGEEEAGDKDGDDGNEKDLGEEDEDRGEEAENDEDEDEEEDQEEEEEEVGDDQEERRGGDAGSVADYDGDSSVFGGDTSTVAGDEV